MTHADTDPSSVEDQPSSLRGTGQFLYVVAFLVGLAAAIGGIALLMHGVCGVNPYDASLEDCSQKTYPLAGDGTAVLIGGLIQAIVIAVVGRLCIVVALLRTAIV